MRLRKGLGILADTLCHSLKFCFIYYQSCNGVVLLRGGSLLFRRGGAWSPKYLERKLRFQGDPSEAYFGNWTVCSFDHISGANNAMIVVGGLFEVC